MKQIILTTILFMASLSFGQNLILNGGFEAGNTNEGWLNSSAGANTSFNTDAVSDGAAFNTFSISSLSVHEGTRAARLKTGGAALRQVVSVTPGTYIVQFWFTGSKLDLVIPVVITNWTGDVEGANLPLTPLVADSGANAIDNTTYGCQITLDDGSSSSWNEAKFTFEVDETIQKVRFTYFLPSGNEIGFLDQVSIILDNKASVDDIGKFNFSVYPNPAKDLLHIESLNAINKVEIYDMTGKLVLRSKDISNNYINISKIHEGIYTIIIQDANKGIGTSKLVISK